MTPTDILDISTRPPNSILNLHNSTEPWHAQITKAASILGLDIDSAWRHIIEAGEIALSQRDIAVDPRLDWTLRWLLKKFEPQERQPSEECKNLEAWILLREVVARCSTANVARLLRAHHFVSVIKAIFLYMRDDTVLRLENPENEDGSSVKPMAEKQVSKKRKRESLEGAPRQKAAQVVDVNALFIAVCSVLGQTLNFTKSQLAGSEDYAVEHLKHALKCTSQNAADILGNAFYVTNNLLQVSKRAARIESVNLDCSSKAIEDTAYRCCLAPLVELWDLHLARSHEDLANTTQRSFLSSCAIPSLQVLQTCQEWFDPEDDAQHVSSILTRLLTDHVILPFRSQNLSEVGQSALNKDQEAGSLSNDLSAALNERPLAPRNIDIRADEKTKFHLKGSLLSLLFSIAAKSRPRHTQRLRQTEDLWLEKLYFQLDTVADPSHQPEITLMAQKSHRRLLKWLLEIAVDTNIKLSVSSLQHTLHIVSGLFESHDDQNVDWGLVNLCLSIDADAFVVPESKDYDGSNALYRPPSEYLKRLLKALTKCKIASVEDKDSITSDTLIPLLDSFVRARDFPGFIEHWREQLSQIMHKAEGSVLQESIWDADALQLAVSKQVETLATAQLSEIVLRSSGLVTACIQDMHDDKVCWLQELVILESILGGINKEPTIDLLGNEVQSIFLLLMTHLTTKEIERSRYRWRLWRTMTIISERWSPKYGYQKIQSAVPTATDHALVILEKLPAPDEGNSQLDLDLTEEYHAFRYILSFAALSEIWDSNSLPSFRKGEKAIQRIIDIMEPFCQRVENDVWGTYKDVGRSFTAFGPSTSIKSIGALYLACVWLILSTPKVLRRLDQKLQAHLIEQSYACALYHSRSSLQLNHDHIDLMRSWQQLQRTFLITDSLQLRDSLMSFQIRRYLQVSRFDEPDYWDITSTDYRLAFEGLNLIPVGDLSRNQRTTLANRLLRIITSCNMVSIANITMHLTALQKLVDKPSNSMSILNNQEASSKDEPQPKPRREIAMLQLTRLIDNKFKWSVDNVECIDRLEKLCQTILKHLISTLDRESSIKYLQALYNQLAMTLEQRHNKKPSGSSFSVVAKVSLTALHDHRNRLSGVLSNELSTLQATRLIHLENLLLRMGQIMEIPGFFHFVKRSKMKDQHNLGIDLTCMVNYVDLIRIHPDLAGNNGITSEFNKISDQLQQLSYQISLSSDRSPNAFKGIEYIAACLARLEMAISYGDDGLVPYLEEVSNVFNESELLEAQYDANEPEMRKRLPIFSATERNTMLYDTQNAILTLGSIQKARLLSTLVMGSGSGNPMTSKLYLMRSLILSLCDEDIEKTRTTLSKACTWLCHELGQDIDYRAALIAMQCLSAFLQRQPRCVNQWQIDNILSVIAIVSCRLQNQREEMQSGMLFTGLCRLFITILRTHRRRIGGRYHLVLPALQGLLGCLFMPYSTNEGDAAPESAFAVQHTAEFSRILTMLCDPTVSAVTRSNKSSRAELNDETKKARNIAGQYLQYLIIEYCGCQLKGKIRPEMRTALNLGLWAVLGVTSKDVLKAMNAAMDSSRRNVFKALYDDFKKFGEWKGG